MPDPGTSSATPLDLPEADPAPLKPTPTPKLKRKTSPMVTAVAGVVSLGLVGFIAFEGKVLWGNSARSRVRRRRASARM